jgi:hypothetical protein
LPLVVLTGALFAASIVTYLDYRAAGPGYFPLYGLFLTLGFVSAIGSVISWFFATDEPELAPGSEFPRYPRESPTATTTRTDLGRPAPEVSSARSAAPSPRGLSATAAAPDGTAEPWDEDALPPAAPRGPRPILTTPDDPGDIQRALEEIAEIQRELASRPTPPPAGPDRTARA